MAQVTIQEEYTKSASDVWAVLRDFGGLDSWMAGVNTCTADGEGVGAVRDVGLGEVIVKERLEAFDDEKRSLAYTITEGPLPFISYLSTISVTETGAGSCRVDWVAEFELPEAIPADAIAGALGATYGGALQSLKAHLEGKQ